MKKQGNMFTKGSTRRSFLKNGTVAGAATMGAGLLSGKAFALDREDGDRAPITKGDIAILTFLSALEQVEADLWIQYAELGGATNQGFSPIEVQHLKGQPITQGNAPAYVAALQVLDMDMPQYISDNTDDEISHHRFLNNYLKSKGANPIDLSGFAILPPSPVAGVLPVPRLTNLKHLLVDTTWWTRYRSAKLNPDFGNPKFENAVPDLVKAPHPAIPLTSDDATLNGKITKHQQAIASTAGFHFGFIEQGGSSLYPTLAQKVNNLEVLRVLLSIGPSETMHFQVWHDKAGNAPQLTDGDLSFPVLDGSNDPNDPNASGTDVADSFQANPIMPEPTFFLNADLGPVSIIRPTSTAQGGAVAAVQSFVDDGLFFDPSTNSNTPIVAKLMSLAEEADEARRRF